MRVRACKGFSHWGFTQRTRTKGLAYRLPISFLYFSTGWFAIIENLSDLVINFNHPLYLHLSDTPSALLVSHQLLGIDNYNVWSRSMKIALLAKNKLVSRELSAGIVFASSVTAVWKDLGERFYKSNIVDEPITNCKSNLLYACTKGILEAVEFECCRFSNPASLHSAHVVQKKQFNGTCHHFKIKGYKREKNCYRIIGYPADFKFTKKKTNNVLGSAVNNVSVNDSASSGEVSRNVGTVSGPQVPVFTQTQYQ
ncbi:hypothetical protein PVK06_007064 [Gossypium arboreum]|uniref:Retrotransposon Copia-like N-terminal domain-containing protein n=1 Tax=Gossypium arboreum TaxID=29729 RepID=A0ABR0QGB6_GOSAR|nr:hypothetical protein PVK06_007064 [Gossypium arboreum]